jgi:hypothetical protein
LKKKQLILALVVLLALAALLYWGRDRIHFDFAVFRSQLARADWRKIALGIGCIYLAYVVRAVRWAQLLKHHKKLPALSLLGTQVIGFTAVALIGRVADLVRPYLVARRTGLPLSSQIAVYIVERLFDAGSMALIFSVAMIGVPTDEIIKATAHSGPLAHLANWPSSSHAMADWRSLSAARCFLSWCAGPAEQLPPSSNTRWLRSRKASASPSATRFAPSVPASTPCAPSVNSQPRLLFQLACGS